MGNIIKILNLEWYNKKNIYGTFPENVKKIM